MLNAYQRARLILFTASAICGFISWQIARLAGFPPVSGLGSSVALNGGFTAFIIIAATFAVCLMAGTAMAASLRFNAGMVTACIGLAAISIRGGGIREIIFSSPATMHPADIFRRLAMETALLTFLLGAGWLVLLRLYFKGAVRDREGNPFSANAQIPRRNELPSASLQTLANLLLLLVLSASPAKFQALAAVGIASFAASIIAQMCFPTASWGWYWLPPLLVGILGHFMAAFHPDGVETGYLTGRFAALSRPVPLDYASIGPAAAIVGHWLNRIWSREMAADAGNS